MQQQGEAGARMSPGEVLDNLRNGLVARLMPLMRDALDAALRELDGRASANPPSPSMVEDRTDIGMLLREVLAYERRWQEQIDALLRGWPALSRARTGGFELMADSELQIQLVGAPAIDALERRFSDAVDLLDRRLYTVAARMGASERPRNPFAPGALAETFLRAFTVLDSSARVHALVLKHFVRLASERLGAVYQWCNTVLSDAGYELSSGNEGVLVPGMSPELARVRPQPDGVAQAPMDALRRRLIALGRARQDATGARMLRDEELLAVIDLLQADRAPPADGGAAMAESLRLRIDRAAASIGLPPGEVARSPSQEAAVEVTGRLFDHLRQEAALSAAASGTLSRLALPWLRAALESPGLFDDPGRPSLLLLSTLVELWDGSDDGSAAGRTLHRIADQAAGELLADPGAGLSGAARLLEQIDARVEPVRRRADMASRRLWQSMQGKERLEAARGAADQRLREAFARGPLPPVLAGFLSEHWRQWLVQAWLRDGVDSDRYGEAVALGERLLEIDGERDGHRLAQALLAVEPTLRECAASSGLQEDSAAAVLSALVGEFADPDRPRQPATVEPLATECVEVAVGEAKGIAGLQDGDRLVRRRADGTRVSLQLAWRSPLTGRALLVDAQGARVDVMEAQALRTALAKGELQHRHGDPVRNALAAIAAAIDAAGDA